MAAQEIGEILVPADDLNRRVRELGAEISRDYEGRDLLLVGVLKGAVFFLSDLMRHISIPCQLDFMAVASYGSSTDTSGVVRILKDLDASIEGRDVLIVEDIVDSGLTLSYLLRTLKARNPASLDVCALLTKPERRKVELPIRYVGFEIPNQFAIGYGLDHGQRYRNLLRQIQPRAVLYERAVWCEGTHGHHPVFGQQPINGMTRGNGAACRN